VRVGRPLRTLDRSRCAAFAIDSGAVLHLASETSPDWLPRARAHLDEVLLDHAHCEKKAAGAAVKLLFSYPHYRVLQEPLAELAREELEHFRQVLARLDARGIRYETIRPSPYGMALHGLTRRDEPDRLVDILLISALIEARSCERFQLLAAGIDDGELAKFYASLLASEARHHGLYVELAGQLHAPADLEARLSELAAHEAEIIARPCDWVRLHAG
jgi:tRNA-(ms[2]io[6]A)-hydroxylase